MDTIYVLMPQTDIQERKKLTKIQLILIWINLLLSTVILLLSFIICFNDIYIDEHIVIYIQFSILLNLIILACSDKFICNLISLMLIFEIIAILINSACLYLVNDKMNIKLFTLLFTLESYIVSNNSFTFWITSYIKLNEHYGLSNFTLTNLIITCIYSILILIYIGIIQNIFLLVILIMLVIISYILCFLEYYTIKT